MNADVPNFNVDARCHPRALADVLTDPKAEWDAREAAARMTGQQRGRRAGGPVPARCLSGGNSGKVASFKGSLKNVTEDQEASNAEGRAGDPEEGRSVGSSSGSASRRLRKALPARLARVSPMLYAAGDVKSDTSSSSASRSRRQVEEGINLAGVNNSLSNLVDSQGFLGRENDTSSDSRPTWKSDSSSTKSSRGCALPARMPLYGPGSYRKAQTGGPLPARRLTKSSSTKSVSKGSSFRGSLKNVVEDKESTEDVDADANNFDEDSSSQSSWGSLRPPRRTPLYAPGTWRKAKMGGPLPVRRLTRSSSTNSVGKGSSFRGSLKNVVEDRALRESTATEDLDANANDFNEDSSSQLSGGSLRPSRRTPLYAPRTWRKAKTGGPLPARRLMRSSSTKSACKGSSFRCSLKNVLEDKEADMGGEADDLEESRSVHTAPYRRRKTPLSRKLRTGVKKHFRLFHSDTTSSTHSSCMNESVDIMDFGVDPDMLSLCTSSATHTTSRKDSYSNFVDSQGFLGWNNETSSDSELVGDAPRTGACRPALRRDPARRRLGSSGSSASSLTGITGLADSTEYLGWDSQRRLADSAKDLGTGVGAEEGREGRPAPEAEGGNLEPPGETWRIEDDEGSIDPNDLGNPLSKIKRFSSKATEGIALKRPSWNPVGGVPTEIQTNHNSRRRGWYRSDSEPLPNRNKAKDDKGLLARLGASLGASNASQSLDIDDEYYSHGTIRINQNKARALEVLEVSAVASPVSLKPRALAAGPAAGPESLGPCLEHRALAVDGAVPAPEADGGDLNHPGETWRIEDDEGSIDPNDLGNPPSKMKQFSSKVIECIALKRPPWNPAGGVPTEIQTNRNSGRRGWYRSDSEPLPNRNKAKDDKGLLARFGASLGASNASQSLDIDDEYYSRGTIRISQKEDVHVEKLPNEAHALEVLEVSAVASPVSLKPRALAAGPAAGPESLGPCLEPRVLAAGGAVPGKLAAPGAAAPAKSVPPVPEYNIAPEISLLAKNFVDEFSRYFDHDQEVQEDKPGAIDAGDDPWAAMDREGTERRAPVGVRGWYRSDSEPLPNRNKAKDDKALLARLCASWGGASNASQSLDIDDEYYSRGNIRINREEDVDIGELRRELLKAGAEGPEENAKPSRGRRMGFF